MAIASRGGGLGLDDGNLLGFPPGGHRCRPARDLLPLAGVRRCAGNLRRRPEKQAAPKEPKPHCVQSFTYTFACERRPQGENHVIPKPEKYEHYRDSQPYSLKIEVHGGEIYGEESGWLEYRLFDTMPGTKGGLWSYRRLLDTRFSPFEITMFNWPGNDYRDRSIIDRPAREVVAALHDAKLVSLGFLYWLQTQAPELCLRPDVMGTADGLSKHPYIRESRRIRALKTIVEQEVSANYQKGPRAAAFPDSVGVGWYPIDIPPLGPEDCRRELPHQAVPDPARRLIPIRRRICSPAPRTSDDPHHQRLLPPAPGGGMWCEAAGCAGGLCARARSRSCAQCGKRLNSARVSSRRSPPRACRSPGPNG